MTSIIPIFWLIYVGDLALNDFEVSDDCSVISFLDLPEQVAG